MGGCQEANGRSISKGGEKKKKKRHIGEGGGGGRREDSDRDTKVYKISKVSNLGKKHNSKVKRGGSNAGINEALRHVITIMGLFK